MTEGSPGWTRQIIGQYAPFTYGKGLPEHARSPGSVPVYGSNGLVGYHNESLTNGPTIIIGRKGTVGAVHYSRVPCWPIDTTFYVEEEDIELLRFKYYLLHSLGLEHMNADSAVPGLNRDAAHSRQVFTPSPPEQRAIAYILGTLDDKIELNRRMNETLEEMARALFKSWFVDFDPVRAKGEGRQPAGMDAATAALFPDAFEGSAQGPIPSGWKTEPLPQVLAVNPSRPLSNGIVAPYLDMRAMPITGHRPDSWIERTAGSGARFRNGDTLVARITPCLENGKTAFVDFLKDDEIGWGSTEYIVLRPHSPIPPEFAYYLARTDEFRTHAIQNMTGTSGRQRVPVSCLDQYLLALPPAGISKRFGQIARDLMARIRMNAKESQGLSAMREALLPRLLSGEIRVSEAERLVEAAI